MSLIEHLRDPEPSTARARSAGSGSGHKSTLPGYAVLRSELRPVITVHADGRCSVRFGSGDESARVWTLNSAIHKLAGLGFERRKITIERGAA